MLKYIIRYRAAVVVMTFCALLLASCQGGPHSYDEILEVSVKKTSVESAKGQMFVSIKSSSSWTLSLSDAETHSSVDWATLNITSGKGNANNIILSYQGNTGEQKRVLRITVTNARDASSCDVEQAGTDARPDDEPDEDEPVQDGTSDLTKAQWLELPAMDNPDLGYYTHSFEMDDNTYRNYSFGWSQKDRVALWVAYPLCKLYTNGSAGRTNAWALDPLLGNDSAAPFSGYAGDYARGHQLPSADRQCCYDANAQTFYGTNMTPQLNAHNEGIWSSLESKVRNIANSSDTTYVVTGVIVSDSSLKETDSYGASVTVPDAYFKVLLRYSKSSTLGQWNAAAFYLEHRKYTENLGKQHSMSVDELEEITGIDFFANLPAKVGESQAAKVEAAVPADVALWW